jgi:hypothetical protein
MKMKIIAFIFLSGALFVRGQGTFVWDQQATGLIDSGVPLTSQPMGESFTPSFSSIDVAAFNLGGGTSSFGDIVVNLRSGSITGTILGTTAAVTFTSSGVYDFFFSSPIALTPGTQYFLQPEAASGSGVFLDQINAPSGSGHQIISGVSRSNFDFWYQEGVTAVPEPSSATLIGLVATIAYRRRRNRCKSQ